MDQLIKFKANTELFSDRSEAIIALRNIVFTQGEPVIAIYGTTQQNAKIILAIGKKDGAGKDAFEIVSTGEDITEVLEIINNLENSFMNHIRTSASGNTLGHVISGGDIVFNGGIGTVNSAGKVKNKLFFLGGNPDDNDITEFDGSSEVTIKIPEPSNEPARPLSYNTVGSSNRWARADHTHEAPKTVTGNAGSADRLSSNKNISLTGAVTGNVVTDFSGNNIVINTTKNHTHGIPEVTNLQENLTSLETLKAPINNPEFTGIPTAPTPSSGTNTNQLATTAFVIKEIGEKIEAAIALRFKGTLGKGGTITSLPPRHITGDTYVAIQGAPNISGKKLEPGDVIICIRDSSTVSDSDWTVVQANVEIDKVVFGPENAVISGNLVTFDGTTGKLISDSGASLRELARITTSITAGPGLIGGGTLESNRTISHASRPGSGTNAISSAGSFITEVKVDSFGHVAEVLKGDLEGSYSSPPGEYINNITLTGNTLIGTSRTFPNLEIENGRVNDPEEFISGLSIDTVNNHKIIVEKGTIPGIVVKGDNNLNERRYISNIKSDGHHEISFTTTEESGKVKLDEDSSADYLKNKILSGREEGNTYSVEVTKSVDALILTTTINKIDGGDDRSSGEGRRQVIKLKRYYTSGITPGGLEEGELAINLSDNYLYTNNGTGTIRIYPNATSSVDGLMSKTDKSNLDKALIDINTNKTNIDIINGRLSNIELNLNTTKQELEDKISEEAKTREESDQSIISKIDQEISERTEELKIINSQINNITSEFENINLTIEGEINSRENGDKYNLSLLRNAVNNINDSSGFIGSAPDDESIYSKFPDLSDTHYLRGQSNVIGCLRILDNKLYELEQALTIKILP